MTNLSHAVKCPTCGAAKDEKCRSRKTGSTKMNYSHRARFDLAEKRRKKK
jgi:hypothetical protein